MKITQFSTLNPKFLRIVLFLALSAIFLYSFSGIASIFAPDVGAIVYALISCLALFFSIIILIVNHLLHPRRVFPEIILYVFSYIALFFLACLKCMAFPTDAEAFISILGNCATILGFSVTFLDFTLTLLSELNYPIYTSQI